MGRSQRARQLEALQSSPRSNVGRSAAPSGRCPRVDRAILLVVVLRFRTKKRAAAEHALASQREGARRLGSRSWPPAFVAFSCVASCAANPTLVKASFAGNANDVSSAPAWVDLRADESTLCARDATGAVACAVLESVPSCLNAACTGREPHHFRATTLKVPPIAASAIAVAHTAWVIGDDGGVGTFRLEHDGEPKLDDVPWFHGALAIEATSYGIGPASGVAVTDNIQFATLACARMPNGEIRCTMPTNSFYPPVQLTLLVPSSAITVGWGFACAITASARAVMCWGVNAQGQLGDGTRRPSQAATLVRGVDDAIQVDAWGAAACAVRADGRVACWGHTYWDEVVHDTPQWIPELTNVAEIALGFDHICARLRSGVIACFGKNDRQQLGSVEASEDVGRSTIGGLGGVVKIVAIGRGTCALRSNHSIVCWGMQVAPQTIALSNASPP